MAAWEEVGGDGPAEKVARRDAIAGPEAAAGVVDVGVVVIVDCLQQKCDRHEIRAGMSPLGR